VGRLSAGVAHDFNNLLAPILTVAGVVRDELPADSPLRADLEDIRGAAAKARDLVRTLQTLSRKAGAQLERIPLGIIVAESEEFLRRFAGTRFGFVLRLAEGVPIVLADRPLIELALANLVVNAREGAVRGKVIGMDVAALVVSAADAARLNVRAGRHAAVTVAEAGVPSGLLAGIDGFGSVQSASSADPGGAGVGMPTVNGIAAQYGGGVFAREAPGAGWVVRLLLPEAPTRDYEG
jgi:K+-sensing histidine kinase KdpD